MKPSEDDETPESTCTKVAAIGVWFAESLAYELEPHHDTSWPVSSSSCFVSMLGLGVAMLGLYGFEEYALYAWPNDGAWAKVVVEALAEAMRGGGGDGRRRTWSIADDARSIGACDFNPD
jgi:hypothetical protein